MTRAYQPRLSTVQTLAAILALPEVTKARIVAMDINVTEQERQDIVDGLIEAWDTYREKMDMEDYEPDDYERLTAKMDRTQALIERLTSIALASALPQTEGD